MHFNQVIIMSRLRWRETSYNDSLHNIISSQLKQRQNYYREAQLSQTDCAMLCFIEYFAKPLKVIRNDILEKGVSPY